MCAARNAARRTSPKSARVCARWRTGDGRREDGGGEGMRSREGSGGGWSGMHSSQGGGGGSALERERGRAVVGAADAMRVPLRVQQRQSQCAGALCRGARGGTI